MGNPPYSVGQTSANDNNANLKYPTLDARIAETYAAKSTAQLKNSLYDSYLRAFRWATDRIGDQGIVAFVSNGGWVDANTGDGVRLSMAEDFNDVYLFNLRGNQRTAGEQSRKEGGKVFGSGSRAAVSILIGVKDPNKPGFELHYRDIGDYLSAAEKLAIVDSSTIENIEWRSITPNRHGDWLNQRSDEFATWPVISEKKGDTTKVFSIFSGGLKTNRDSWVYRFGQCALETDVESSVEFFNSLTSKDEIDPKRIKWSSKFDSQLAAKRKQTFDPSSVREVMYRPFNRQNCYFNPELNDRPGRLPTMFPTLHHHNIGYVTTSPGDSVPLGTLATNIMPDLHALATSQFFPRFTWEPVKASDGGLFGEGASISEGESSIYGQVGEVVAGYVRKDNITDEIKVLYREALGADVTGDDIFHFVYGKLHDPNYREAYAADLKKMLPHIETPGSREEFDKFARAGKELMDLHVGYEDVEPYPLDIAVKGDESDPDTWRVLKMKWARKKDPETDKNVNDVTKLIYNKRVTIAGIPAEADEYMLGSRSALAWLIDRYQVKKDKASGIVNDPNDWADEVGNPRYIVDLIGKVTRVAVETVRIVEGLRE